MYNVTIYLGPCILSYHLHAQTQIWPLDPFQGTRGRYCQGRVDAGYSIRTDGL
jgi:hypothetical protein